MAVPQVGVIERRRAAMKTRPVYCLLTSLFCLLIPQVVRADDYRTARVSDVRGSLAARGVEDSDVSFVERNAILRDGDVLWTDDRSRSGLELERGSWIRLAEDTK